MENKMKIKKAGLPKDAHVLVMTVVDAFMPPAGNYSEMSLPESTVTYIETTRKQAQAHIEKRLAQARKTADKAAKNLRAFFQEWTINSDACVDSPSWGIVKKGEEWKPDLIVVGSFSFTQNAQSELSGSIGPQNSLQESFLAWTGLWILRQLFALSPSEYGRRGHRYTWLLPLIRICCRLLPFSRCRSLKKLM